MKKITKILALSLAVVPCALAFTACNKSNPVVLEGYQDAKYTESTYDTFAEELQTRGTLAFSGLKERTKLSLTLTTDPSGLAQVPGMPNISLEPTTETLELENYSVVSGLTSQGPDKISSDFSLKYNDEKYDAQAYYTDETFFVNLKGLDLKENLGEQYDASLEKFSYSVAGTETYAVNTETQFTLDLAGLLTMLDESDYASIKQQVLAMTTWSTETTDTNYRVKVEFNGEQTAEFLTSLVSQAELNQFSFDEVNITTLTVYLVFGETSLEGVALDLDGSLKLNMGGLVMEAGIKLNTEIAVTTEEVKLPSGLNTKKYPPLDTSKFNNLIPQA